MQAESKKNNKRIPVGAIDLQLAGDLVLPRLTTMDHQSLFRRYEALFECFANMDRDQRRLNYMLLTALILTSYAKKSSQEQDKKTLFEKKNEIYLKIANDPALKRKVAFKYLLSKNFRVLNFCVNCTTKNNEENLAKHKWKFCDKCNIDRSFFNVLSMHHKFDDGFCTLFLSNDLMPKINGLRTKGKGKLVDFNEEARFNKYIYNIRNLDVFALESVLELHYKLCNAH